jgi:hypothetical protein
MYIYKYIYIFAYVCTPYVYTTEDAEKRICACCFVLSDSDGIGQSRLPENSEREAGQSRVEGGRLSLLLLGEIRSHTEFTEELTDSLFCLTILRQEGRVRI